MRVAMMGSGGLGGLLGGLQARAGHDVIFIARGENLRALRERGLTVRLPGDEFHLEVPGTDDPRELGPVDLVWFCVKTYDVDAAAKQVLPLIGPETMVLPMQNGVGTAERLSDVVGEAHVIGGINIGGATLVSPGVIEAKGLKQEVALGELKGGTSRRTEDLCQALNEAGVDTQLQADIQASIWDKWVVACVSLGLCTLFRRPLLPIVTEPESTELALGVMREAVAVASAKGIALPEGTPERWLEYCRERVQAVPTLAGSMMFDLRDGRRLELEAMNGAAVRLGRELGVPTPLNMAVYAALLPYLNGAPKSS